MSTFVLTERGSHDSLVIDSYTDEISMAVNQGQDSCEVVFDTDQVRGLRDWLSAYLDAPTAPKLVIPEECNTAEEVAAPPQGVSDVDKLRILAAVIDAQAPFGTDLADFKRRLQIVLGL